MIYEVKALYWERYNRPPVEKTIYIKYLLSDVYDKMLEVGTIFLKTHYFYLIKYIAPIHFMPEQDKSLIGLEEIEIVYKPDRKAGSYVIDNVIFYYIEKDNGITYCHDLTDLLKEIKYFKSNLGDRLEFNLSRLNDIERSNNWPLSNDIEKMNLNLIANCFFIAASAGEGGDNAI